MDRKINGNKKTFHLDLSHVMEIDEILSNDLTFHMGSKKYPIYIHTPETLSQSKEINKALNLIPNNHIHKISHFAEVPAGDISNDRLCLLQVTVSNKNPNILLPELLLLSYYIPQEIRLKHFQKKISSPISDRNTYAEIKLSYYNINFTNSKIQETVWNDVEEIVTPMDAAIAVLFNHPELGSTNPDTASIIKYNHICNKNNKSHLGKLADTISEQGKGKWAQVSPITEPDGKIVCYEYDVTDEKGNILHKQGDTIYQYKLSDKTLEATDNALGSALKTSKDDLQLQNKKWSVSAGLCAESYEQKETPSRMNLAKETTPQEWTITERTQNYGLYVYRNSIKIDEKGNFSIDFRNVFLRSLGAYVQFFDDKNNIIETSDLIQIPEFLRKIIQPNPQKKFLDSISAVNTVMGVPVPLFADKISFPFPQDASSVKLIFGGFGTSDWDSDVIWPGIISTGIFQYAIPTVFLVAGAYIESTSIYKKIMEDKEFQFALISAAVFFVGPIEAYRSVTGDTKAVLSSLMSMLANLGIGILYKKGLELLLGWVLAKITAAQLETAIPFVGWASAIAQRAITAVQLAETTVELLSSPAKIEVEIKRQMSLHLTLVPDSKHGGPKEAVWPSSSDHYQVTVMYKGGTNFINKGPMYHTTSNQPIIIDFNEIPKGGELKLIAGIYSSHDILVGKWESEWISAFPGPENILNIEHEINEVLIPLTPETEYIHKEKIIYNDQKHTWLEGERPKATAASLDCSNIGAHLCELVNLTINNRFNQIGYCWKASNLGLPICSSSQIENGQNYAFQNISILSDPDLHLKFPNCSLSIQPTIAYDQFGQVEGKEDADSMNNFYLDSQNGTYHLRQIDLTDPSQIIDLQPNGRKSWGKFSQDHLDSIVVHPDGYVIAVSWMNHKMEILKIPEAPSDDDKAFESQFVSGEGVREGLMKGPIALTVTPDGRILLLESINRRIQAFDTKGDPVPSFEGEHLFNLSLDIQNDLDKGIFSDKLQELFQNHDLTYLCDIPEPGLREDLNNGIVFEFANQFIKNGFYLSYDKDHPDDRNISSYVNVKIKGQKWTIIDPVFGKSYDVVADESGIKIYENLNENNATITVRSQNKMWIITDHSKGKSYSVKKEDNGSLELYAHLSTMQLHNPKNDDLSYLDLAVESKGYIYVLSFEGNDKSNATNYLLDIYEPNGNFLTRTEGVNAARIAVNLWRDLYTLNYEMILGPGGRPEPSISHWYPQLKNVVSEKKV